jgi:hypothetical protein
VAAVLSFRTDKMYSISQAARLARTTPQSVHRWLYGTTRPSHSMKPVFGERSDDDAAYDAEMQDPPAGKVAAREGRNVARLVHDQPFSNTDFVSSYTTRSRPLASGFVPT